MINKKSSRLFLEHLSRLVPLSLFSVNGGEIRIKVSPQNLVPLITILKHHTGIEFSQLVDITAID